ncbi:zf-HC2 domain-containing protein [Nonomuraea sp. SMC257]|uniref:Zf-HC2 domain-containing protein n=1 Tax=Nonomuraea montanisoli TaxID=2741721 RepID=A0A7Y6M7C2_9ACTN|nr:zf-HC2 domain-containing protein [Nonomuraea montanisoli]NUW37863.1 zf-HC2 domain-containing protein [Nonomuraea montanisoli]
MSAVWHPPADLVRRYATGGLDPVQVMSVEAHIARCPRCRAAVPYEEEWLGAAWERIEDVVDRPRPGPGTRLLVRAGVPEHTARLLTATPSLTRAWLVAVTAVLAFAVVAARVTAGDPDVLLAFLVVAPVLPVAGIALAYGRPVDPAYELHAATPMAGTRLFLLRAVAVLSVAFALTGAATLLLPGPLGLSAAWLLPALTLGLALLALSGRLPPLLAGSLLAAGWFAVVLVCDGTLHDRFLPFHPASQPLYGGAVLALLVLIRLRHRRLILGERR